jgi:hypothetical protein
MASPVVVLVDLDNVSFYDSGFNEACAFDRIRSLFFEFPSAYFVFFCNKTTESALCVNSARRHELLSRLTTGRASLVAVDTGKDSADHALLNTLDVALRQTRTINIVVVSSDKTLARLAMYMWDKGSYQDQGHDQDHDQDQDQSRSRSSQHLNQARKHGLSFAKFHNSRPRVCSALQKFGAERFQLHFNDAHDLDAFMGSLELFYQRYPRSYPRGSASPGFEYRQYYDKTHDKSHAKNNQHSYESHQHYSTSKLDKMHADLPKSSQPKSNQGKSTQAKSSQAKSGQAKSSQAKIAPAGRMLRPRAKSALNRSTPVSKTNKGF